MKETIESLKKVTGHKSDESFAGFIGCTKNTITRAKAGHKTKNKRLLNMLKHLVGTLNKEQLSEFLQSFKRVSGPVNMPPIKKFAKQKIKYL